MKTLRTSIPLALGAVLALPSSAFPSPQDEGKTSVGKALYQENCARCHGETGDGKGWTELDRPARSFMDGGFSYGNTPEALFRTISMGIPGTPMPGFDSSHTEEQRRALAAYVITLGPEIREVSESETILVVADRPQVVRGKLPPIAEGAEMQPRGLLLGTTDGFTFEYRTDDVRLLGVRQGAFVRRADWTGRGGSTLEPLGRVVHVVEDGKPASTFRDASGAALPARLTGTWVLSGEVGVAYALENEAGEHVATMTESCTAVTRTLAAGFLRRFHLVDQAGPVHLRLPRRGEEVASFESQGIAWRVARREDGLFAVTGLEGSTDGNLVRAENVRWEATTHHFVLSEWNAEIQTQWTAEEAR